MTFKISKKSCQDNIRGVCGQCGGERTPIKTVDNVGNPTYWAGCEKCNIFCSGVDPKIHLIAKKLVTEHGYVHYSHMGNRADIENKPEPEKEYWELSQIGGACDLVMQILEIQKEIEPG